MYDKEHWISVFHMEYKDSILDSFSENNFKTSDKMYFKFSGVQDIRQDKGVDEPAGNCTFFCGSGNVNNEMWTEFFLYKWIISALKRVEFVVME